MTLGAASVVCAAEAHRHAERVERGWRLITLLGSFAFTATGVLASVLGPLAEASVSILAISTFDTDYVLVKEESLRRAVEVLRACGRQVSVSGDSAISRRRGTAPCPSPMCQAYYRAQERTWLTHKS